MAVAPLTIESSGAYSGGGSTMPQRAVSALLCVHPSEVLKTFAALDASCKLALLRVACEAACRASVVEGAMRAKEERREELGRRWEAEEKEERKRKREEREARRAEVRQTLEREGEVNELLVAERMRRLDQEEAVGKTTHVFTRDELAAAEGDRAMELDVAAAGVDESGNQLGAAQVAAAEARRDEMRKRLDRLGASRDAAEERLLQAVDDGKLAMRYACNYTAAPHVECGSLSRCYVASPLSEATTSREFPLRSRSTASTTTTTTRRPPWRSRTTEAITTTRRT